MPPLILRYAFVLPSLQFRFSFASSPLQIRSYKWDLHGSHKGLTWEEGLNER